MSEELNNKDLFNLEDNDPFIGGDDDDFPDLPPLQLKLEEESIDINNIPVEPPADVTVELPAIKPAAETEQPKKESVFSRIFKKKDESEKAPKEKKVAVAKTEKKPIIALPLFAKKEKSPSQPREKKQYDLQSMAPLFWTISGAIALLIAVILLIIVVVIGFNAVKIADAVNQDLVGQLYSSFVAMDQAHIKTTIPIESEVPAQFDLQLDTLTTVTLSEDVTISGATVSLSTGGLQITSAPTSIILPAGSELPIHLVLTVPVDEMIPVVMDVEVDIPMSQTELHDPFLNLQQTIQPYYMWLWSLTTKGVSPLALPWNQ